MLYHLSIYYRLSTVHLKKIQNLDFNETLTINRNGFEQPTLTPIDIHVQQWCRNKEVCKFWLSKSVPALSKYICRVIIQILLTFDWSKCKLLLHWFLLSFIGKTRTWIRIRIWILYNLSRLSWIICIVIITLPAKSMFEGFSNWLTEISS